MSTFISYHKFQFGNMYTCTPATVRNVKYNVFESTDSIIFFIRICN